jgi:hypothetical protein
MNFRTALAATTMLALPIAAGAQPITGPYISGGVGIGIMHDESARIVAPLGAGGSGWLRPDIGPATQLSLGYGMGNGFRTEIEGDYLYNSLHGAKNTAVGAKEQKFGAMLNFIYDFTDYSTSFTPYFGLGAGFQWVKEQHLYGGGFTAKADTRGVFAWQTILGASMPITSVPGLAMTADYRFMGLQGARDYAGTTPNTNFRLNNNFTHTVMVGLLYAFNTPEAAAPMTPVASAPVPSSPAARSYLVFFDWDRADLTPRATQIVADAAASSQKVAVTRIEVNGYTDTSGTPAYNQGLSIRRAKVVMAELVKDGVPAAAIVIQGYGETNLLVPTGANVREPQNRRVEIILK